MDEIVTRTAPCRDHPRDLWRSIPLELAVSAVAVIAAGLLKLAGVMP